MGACKEPSIALHNRWDLLQTSGFSCLTALWSSAPWQFTDRQDIGWGQSCATSCMQQRELERHEAVPSTLAPSSTPLHHHPNGLISTQPYSLPYPTTISHSSVSHTSRYSLNINSSPCLTSHYSIFNPVSPLHTYTHSRSLFFCGYDISHFQTYCALQETHSLLCWQGQFVTCSSLSM